jgi:hypothetical protein
VAEAKKTKPRSLRVRIAAAQFAVKASEITGRPVDPRVKELAELGDSSENGRRSADR